MAVVIACAVALLFGLACALRWWATEPSPPPGALDDRPGTILLRCVWWYGVAAAAGAATGVLVVGAGGRLAMRLLAVTAGDDAQGRLTEADEVVGDISVGGTIGFVLFIGLGGGLLTGFLYVAVQRWLPGGRWRGPVFGALVFVVFATRLDPLRADNEDFDIVGPAWVAISVFAALGLAQGIAISAFIGRWSRTMPLLTTRRAALRYLPMLLLLLIPPVVLALAVITLVAIGTGRLRSAWPPDRVALVGRVVLGVIGVVALPSFVSSLADIVERSP